MLRQEVLKVYKQIIKSVSKIDDDYYRTDMKMWARNDFKANMKMTDEVSSLNILEILILFHLSFLI